MSQVGEAPPGIISLYALVSSVVMCIGIPLAKIMMLRLKRYWRSAEGQADAKRQIEELRDKRTARLMKQVAQEAIKNRHSRGVS